MTKLASSLPKGEGNGLDAIARKLIDSPNKVHVVLCLVDCKSITTSTDTGEVVPTARIRRIEVIGDMDREPARRMMRRALEQRTGQTVLPYDLEQDMHLAFGRVDPDTGELLDQDPDLGADSGD